MAADNDGTFHAAIAKHFVSNTSNRLSIDGVGGIAGYHHAAVRSMVAYNDEADNWHTGSFKSWERPK